MDATKTIKEVLDAVCTIGARPTGSDAELQAANYFKALFDKYNYETKMQYFMTRASYYYVFALHFALFILTMAIGLFHPGDGIFVGIIIIVSYWGDLSARHHFLRDIFPRKKSVNVVAKQKIQNKKRRLILIAHLDSGRSGFIYRPEVANGIAYLFKYTFRKHCAPYYYLFLIMVISVIALIVRWMFPFAIFTIPALIVLALCILALLVGLAAMLEIGLSGVPVQGANGNASGLAVMSALLETFSQNPLENTEVWGVASGSKMSSVTGMKKFSEKYFDEFDVADTYFINFDHVGNGSLRYVISEGWVAVVPYPYEMTMLAEEVVKNNKEFSAVSPYVIRSVTDGVVPARFGYKTLTLTALNENDYAPNYMAPSDQREFLKEETLKSTYDFAYALAQHIDKSE